jgi:mono/diheme cytochrome c family protein
MSLAPKLRQYFRMPLNPVARGTLSTRAACAFATLTIAAAAMPLSAQDVTTFHINPQRTGWDAQEKALTPQSVGSSSFGMIWQSELFDVVRGRPPRLFASPLYVDRVEMRAGAYQGGTFSVVFAATSNSFVYAVNAFPTDSVPPGTILWRTALIRHRGNTGITSTPVIDLARKTLYATSGLGDGRWEVFALDITSGEVLPRWPVTIDAATLAAPGMDKNAPAVADAPYKGPTKSLLGVQRGALNLSPDGTRLYVTFGESLTGWIVALDTDAAKVATAFSSVATHRNYSGGIWGSGGPAIDAQGDVFIPTGTNFGGFTPQPHDWGQSILKLSDSKSEGFALIGTYTPFNYRATAATDIDLGSGGVCLIPPLDSATTTTPELLAIGGKQGNIYLVNRAHLPGRLDERPPDQGGSDSDQSLLSPDIQPQFGKPGPLNVFGPYTESNAALNGARGRSVPAYFRDPAGVSYLLVTGSTKSAADFNTNVAPGLVRLKIVTVPGRPAYLQLDQEQKDVIFENPGSPIITSNGSRDAVVWVLDENAHRTASLYGASAPHPVLYAFDPLTLRLLWKSRPNQLYTSGKYNEPTCARGTVFVGTDRIQAFGLGKIAESPPPSAEPGSAEDTKLTPLAQGKELFNSGGSCATCHQANGEGVANVFPPLAGSEWVTGSEDRVVRIMLHGLQGAVQVAGKDYRAAAMPGFGQVEGSAFDWDDEKIALVLTYMRQEWGNHAPAVSADTVSEIRKKVGDHKPWSADELLQLK